MKETINESINHNIQINDRSTISISGIKKLESFDNKEFFLESVMGYMLIKGEDLELIKLDTYAKTISIKGLITSLNYLDQNNKKNNKESIINKLFK